MKACPNCESKDVDLYTSTAGSASWVFCKKCDLSGPVCYSKDEAVQKWDNLPRRGDIPPAGGSVYSADGIQYTVKFTLLGPVTLCAITWVNKRGRMTGVQGAAYCSPKDEYSQATGERLSIRRACGVDNHVPYYKHDLKGLYSAWRRERYEAEIARQSGNEKAEDHPAQPDQTAVYHIDGHECSREVARGGG